MEPMSSSIIPTLRYNNCRAMITWLVNVFGMYPSLIVEDDQGGIAHAQLMLGGGMVMLGQARDDAFGRLQQHPETLGSVTQSPYVIVDDVDAVCDRARAAGAEIVVEPQDEDYGGRSCSIRDPEQHLWNVGTYNPWKQS